MEPKDKKWESGPRQDSDDDRTEEQLKRAKEEAKRQNENFEEEEVEGAYREKNGDEETSFDDLKDEPKLDVKPTKPAKPAKDK
nr:hypothetical protein [Pseudopedobacter sp.]